MIESPTPPSQPVATPAADSHAEGFVKGLFDEMARTYGLVNMLSSLGFAYYWRRQAVAALPRPAGVVADLMAGGGECLGHLNRHFGRDVRVDLVDWSQGMCERAESTRVRGGHSSCRVLCCSALAMPVPDQTFDAVVSTFGMKTLTTGEIRLFARELRRVLKPSGHFSILEFSVPRRPIVRFFFQIYVQRWVPLLGRLFLGNPENYRMLWRYTVEFGDCSHVAEVLREEGFTVSLTRWFLGSATQVTGKPAGSYGPSNRP